MNEEEYFDFAADDEYPEPESYRIKFRVFRGSDGEEFFLTLTDKQRDEKFDELHADLAVTMFTASYKNIIDVYERS